jgi:hypothetical protein
MATSPTNDRSEAVHPVAAPWPPTFAFPLRHPGGCSVPIRQFSMPTSSESRSIRPGAGAGFRRDRCRR